MFEYDRLSCACCIRQHGISHETSVIPPVANTVAFLCAGECPGLVNVMLNIVVPRVKSELLESKDFRSRVTTVKPHQLKNIRPSIPHRQLTVQPSFEIGRWPCCTDLALRP